MVYYAFNDETAVCHWVFPFNRFCTDMRRNGTSICCCALSKYSKSGSRVSKCGSYVYWVTVLKAHEKNMILCNQNQTVKQTRLAHIGGSVAIRNLHAKIMMKALPTRWAVTTLEKQHCTAHYFKKNFMDAYTTCMALQQ